MPNASATDKHLPWYRQFWPWFLILLPASTVVAGISTWIIAAQAPDSLVVDDYYKQGLAINQNLARAQRAETLGLAGELRVTEGGVEVRVGPGEAVPETELSLALHHPTRAQLDQVLTLVRAGPGVFRAAGDVTGSRWDVTLTPPSQSWRLSGVFASMHATGAELTPQAVPVTRKSPGPR